MSAQPVDLNDVAVATEAIRLCFQEGLMKDPVAGQRYGLAFVRLSHALDEHRHNQERAKSLAAPRKPAVDPELKSEM